jgi:hypothetical protein
MGVFRENRGTCTSTCTDISLLACTREIDKCSGARPGPGAGGRPSGDARSALRREVHSDARPSKHINEGIDAEPMEATP